MSTQEELQTITNLTVQAIEDGHDNEDIIRRMIREEKYEELEAIKKGFEKVGKPMPQPLD